MGSKKTRTRLYSIWRHMKQRCYNPDSAEYYLYGGRGICVCPEWKDSYEAFAAWAEDAGYTDELTIDRIDCNKNYEPDNCRWATMKEQGNNRRTNRMITWHHKTQSLAQWSDECGINPRTLWSRLQHMSVDDALSTPVNDKCNSRTITYNGETHTIWEWAKLKGIKPTTLSARINTLHWPIERALGEGA